MTAPSVLGVTKTGPAARFFYPHQG